MTATGTPTLSYQWQRNVANVWTNIAAATTNSYPVSSPGAPDDLAQFRVIVTNSGGSVTSSIALLTVNHTLSLVAGMLGGVGNKNAATPTSATFYSPQGVAVDTVNNVVYVADTQDHTIRKIDSTGAVTTFAGTQNTAGLINGTGVAARFNSPRGITVDGAGNVYVADTGNNAIRMITPLGAVTTLAGNGSAGSIDGTGAAARFKAPAGITVDIAGATLYVADTNNDTIRAVTTGGGVVTTFAGFAGTAAWLDDPTTPTNARFNGPAGITMDAAGNLYIADTQNSVIRVISTIGAVTTLAGDGTFGYQDGIGTGSRFGGPTALAVDSAGTAVYVADQGSQTIRAVTTTALGVNGIVTTLAGTNNITGWTDATGSSARFYTPTGIATDGTTVYVADLTTSLIRAVTASSGAVVTYAGNIGGRGALDASTGAAARFDNSHGVASDSAGNLYVADWGNNTIRMITPAGVVTTVAGQAGVAAGFKDATGTAARFNSPRSVATDASGNVYVADSLNRVIRMISMPGPAAVVTTLAGIPGTTGRADGAAGTGTFGLPTGVATDSSGNVYVADWGNNSIRMVTPGGNLTTIAGSTTGTPGAANGTLAASLFRGPRGLVVDSNGVIYVADRDNALIRKVDVAGDLVTTVAGLAATPGFKDALTGPGTAARFNWPAAIAVDTSGNLYVADYNNNAIRKVTPGGVVTTVAGANGSFGVALGNLPGSLSGPSGISVIGGTGTALRIAIADALENSILRAALP